MQLAAARLHPQGRIRILITHQVTIRTVLASIILVILITNIKTRNAGASDLGQQSIIFSLAVQGEQTFVIESASAPQITQVTQTEAIDRNVLAGEEEEFLEERSPIVLSAGSGAIIRTNPAQTLRGARPRDSIIQYIVQQNDTLSEIAYQNTLSIRTILWANNLRSSSIIRPGDTLTIPQVDGVLHTVKKGETINGIAARYKSTGQKIIAMNNLTDGEALQPGTKLTVPDGRPPTYTPPRSTRVAAVTPRRTSSSASIGGSGLIWPTSGRVITQYYSWRHGGLDIDGTMRSPIFAAESGTVETARSGWNGGYGTLIIINNGNGVKTRYAHLSRLHVSPGEKVSRGELIGTMGSTGRSTGSHLHFEVLLSGIRKNPLSYF